MVFRYLNMDINYIKEGFGPPIIFLHGWGSNLGTFDNVVPSLVLMYTVYRIDLPGFGMSDELHSPFALDDYVKFLGAFLKRFEIIDPILIGHSFGGKVIIRYASTNTNYQKLILIASAGIKHRQPMNVLLKVWIFKLKKTWYKLTKNDLAYQKLYEDYGSTDYQNASMVMKATMSKILKVDIKKDLKNITKEALLIWGKYDATTPYCDGVKMNELLVNSGLVTFHESGHFPYLEEQRTFIKVLENYLMIEDTSKDFLKV